MIPDRQKVWTDGLTDGMDGRTDDAKTISLRLRWGINSAMWLSLNPGQCCFVVIA